MKLYKITCIANNCVYIGSTNPSRDNRSRWHEHTKLLRNGKHWIKSFQSDWNIYGKNNFVFEYINGFKSESDAIDFYKPSVYNLHNAKSMTGKNNPNYGKKLSESQKESISKKNSKPVYMIHPTTSEVIKKFDSVKKASNLTGANISNIANCARSGKPKTCGGFKWSYSSGDETDSNKSDNIGSA